MSKIVRLTEQDLVRLVNRVINETEGVYDSKEKNCVQQINKFSKMNGFKDNGVFGDGEMHSMGVDYKKNVKGKVSPDRVLIQIIDWRYGDMFMVEIQMSGGNVILNKQGHTGSSKLDSTVMKLISKSYKLKQSNQWVADFVKGDLNCDSIKSEITNKLKPLEQQLIQMGYKKS